MKALELDALILSEENMKNGLAESTDSTSKKIIYHIPFSQVKLLAKLLKDLEASFGDQTFIDIELCSLEDAYINIAKEEERLMEELNAARAS